MSQERAALVALFERAFTAGLSRGEQREQHEHASLSIPVHRRQVANDCIDALAALPSGGAEGETTHEERTDMPKSISCREFGLCAKDPSRGLGNFCEQCPSQPTPQPPGTEPSGGATDDPPTWTWTDKITTLCVECGPNVRVDEDGCCLSCGNGALPTESALARLRAAVQAEIRKASGGAEGPTIEDVAGCVDFGPLVAGRVAEGPTREQVEALRLDHAPSTYIEEGWEDAINVVLALYAEPAKE